MIESVVIPTIIGLVVLAVFFWLFLFIANCDEAQDIIGFGLAAAAFLFVGWMIGTVIGMLGGWLP